MAKNFDNQININRSKEKPDEFFDGGRQVDKLVDQKVDRIVLGKVKRIERKVFSCKTMPWVNKYADDLINELDRNGHEYTKGQITELAFKLLYEEMEREGYTVDIREEYRGDFESV